LLRLVADVFFNKLEKILRLFRQMTAPLNKVANPYRDRLNRHISIVFWLPSR